MRIIAFYGAIKVCAVPSLLCALTYLWTRKELKRGLYAGAIPLVRGKTEVAFEGAGEVAGMPIPTVMGRLLHALTSLQCLVPLL